MRNPITGYPMPDHNYMPSQRDMRRRVLREIGYIVLTCIVAVAGAWIVAVTICSEVQ